MIWLSFCPWMRPFGQQKAAAAQAERKIHEKILVFLLSPEGEINTRRAIAERVLPVHRRHDCLDLARRETACIQAADHRAHAGAGDGVDGDVQIIEHLKHANVCRAACAAAGQHEPNARPRCARLPRRLLGAGLALGERGARRHNAYECQKDAADPTLGAGPAVIASPCKNTSTACARPR